MDKKELKKITTRIYEEFGFIKKGKYYYLDLDEVLICSGFGHSRGIGMSYLAYNFSLKEFHKESEIQPNNMFDGFDSIEHRIVINEGQKGNYIHEIQAENYTEEQYETLLKKAIDKTFKPFKENALEHIKKGYTTVGYLEDNRRFLIHLDIVKALGFPEYKPPEYDPKDI